MLERIESGAVSGPDVKVTDSVRVRWSETFLIFEPQGIVTVKLFDRVGLDLGVGYRVIGADDCWNEGLQGVTGSIAITSGR